MSAGEMRRTVEANFREVRRQAAAHPAGTPEAAIAAEMSIATTEAILSGMADLMERDASSAAIGPAVAQALAYGMASFVMTVADGEAAAIERLIPSLVRQFERELRGRCADPVGAVVTSSGRPAPGRPS